MQYRLRTLLVVLGLGPPVLAGVWFAARALTASGVWKLLGLVLFVPLLLLLFAPLWIPIAYVAYLTPEREFKVWQVILFTLTEMAAICVSGFLIDQLGRLLG
jgi:hypothetical protein